MCEASGNLLDLSEVDTAAESPEGAQACGAGWSETANRHIYGEWKCNC